MTNGVPDLPSETVTVTGPRSDADLEALTSQGLAYEKKAVDIRKKASDEAVAATEKTVGQANVAYEDFFKESKKFQDELEKLPVPGKEFNAPEPKDPMKAFASPAMTLALIASAFTKTPLTASFNAMAAGMQAIQKGNVDEFNQAHDIWKANTDYAFKRSEWEFKHLNAIFENKKLTMTEKSAQTLMQLTANKDVAGQRILEAQGYEEFAKFNIQRADIMQRTRERRDEFDERLQVMRDSIEERRQAAGLGGTMGRSPEQKDAAAAQAATGMPLNQIIPGYGARAVTARQEAREAAIEQIRAETPNMTYAEAGRELAKRSVEFQMGKTSATQLNTMLGATRQAVKQLDFNIDKAQEELKKLPSSDLSPLFNALARNVEYWTGDPAYSSAYFYMKAVSNESARILGGGQASRAQLAEGARKDAEAWASLGMTPAMFGSVAKAMHDEGIARVKTFEDAIEAQTPGGNPRSPSQGSKEQPFAVTTPAEAQKLQEGVWYTTPDGQLIRR